MSKYLSIAIVFALLVAFQLDADAQCAMCKATAESGGDAGLAKGLNKGIVFLMLIPYLMLMGGVWYFFGDKIKAYLKGRS